MEGKMDLNLKDRLLIYNQARILEALYPDEAHNYKSVQTIMMDGYKYLYDDMVEFFTKPGEELSFEISKLLINFLSMFRAIHHSLLNIPNKDGLDIDVLSFQGFDGNDETQYMSFVQFFCTEFEERGRFNELWEKTHEFNSHASMFDRYQAMHDEWKKSRDQQQLSKEDLIRIQNAIR